MLIHDCIPCQHGHHSAHVDVPGPVAEDVIGGWECHCKGECETDGRRERIPQTREMSPEEVADSEKVMRQFEALSRVPGGEGDG